jgi:two-component system cell cycle sensor histidine kinase/response regulator CckA
MIIVELLYNLFGLVALSVLSGFIDARFDRSTAKGKILQGIIFGAIAIASMMVPYKYAPGVIFDGRSIVISLCTLFFGPVSGIISALFAEVYRIYLGGAGLLMGTLVILSSLLIGWAFHVSRK